MESDFLNGTDGGLLILNLVKYRVSEAYWTQENVNKILIIHFSSTTKLSMCSWGQAVEMFSFLNRSPFIFLQLWLPPIWCTSQPWACYPWWPSSPRPRPGTEQSHSRPPGAHPGRGAWLSGSPGHRCPGGSSQRGLVRATRRPCDLCVARDHSCPGRRSQNNGQLLPVLIELKIDIYSVFCKILSNAQSVQDDK